MLFQIIKIWNILLAQSNSVDGKQNRASFYPGFNLRLFIDQKKLEESLVLLLVGLQTYLK